MNNKQHGAKYRERVVWVIAFLNFVKNLMERLPQGPRVRPNAWRIRQYTGLPQRVADVWFRTAAQHVVVVLNPRHDDALGEAPRIPLGVIAIFTSLQAQSI